MRRAPLRAVLAAATTAATTVAAAAALLAPAQAITKGGTLDDGAHPMVGLMSAQTADGEHLWRCSGTLIDPTTFVTAGHCTSDDEGGSVAEVRVWFDDGPIENADGWAADREVGDDPACVIDGTTARRQGYPCTGGYTGEAFTHPSYDPAQFWLWDLGMVKLDRPVTGVTQFGTLPAVGAFDQWRSNRRQTFTTVGYGLQKALGQGASAQGKDGAVKVRMVARPRLVSINSPFVGDRAMHLTNNSSTGGSCFGDSGGPDFVGSSLVMAGVTSYGMSAQTCGGLGGVYRLDREEDRAWLLCVVDAPNEATARACTLDG